MCDRQVRVFIPECDPTGTYRNQYALRSLLANSAPAIQPFISTSPFCREIVGDNTGAAVIERVSQPGETYRWLNAQTGQVVQDGTQPSGSFAYGASTTTLSFEDLVAEDEGLYVLLATAAGGSERMVDGATLLVGKDLPVILHTPQDREACEGGSTTFTVRAIGDSLSYRWLRNGVPLSDGPFAGAAIYGSDSPTLTIESVTMDVVGMYSCNIDSGPYPIATFEARLMVSAAISEPVIVEQPSSTIASSGETTYLWVGIDAIPERPAAFQWRKDGIPLLDDGRIQGAHTEQLAISFADAGDGGVYDCVVTRACGTTTSAAALLTIALPCPSDVNGDTESDILDFLDFIDSFGTCENQPAPCAGSSGIEADFNGDTSVDILDFLDFFDAFGTGCD